MQHFHISNLRSYGRAPKRGNMVSMLNERGLKVDVMFLKLTELTKTKLTKS